MAPTENLSCCSNTLPTCDTISQIGWDGVIGAVFVSLTLAEGQYPEKLSKNPNRDGAEVGFRVLLVCAACRAKDLFPPQLTHQSALRDVRRFELSDGCLFYTTLAARAS
jgi:hypothetical protein